MNKSLKVLFSFLLVILVTLPVMQLNAVEASSKYAEGEYSLPFSVLKDNSNEQSVTNDYMNTQGKLIVKDGRNYVQVSLKNSSWWQYFKVQNGGSFANVTVLSEGNDTQLVQFEVQDVDQLVNAKVHIIVPDINYDNKYDIRFKFNTSNVSVKAANDTTTKVETEGTANDNVVEKKETTNNTSVEQKDATNNDEAEKTKTNPEKNPQTGDQTPILLFSIMLLLSGFVLVRKVAFK